ncbi:hypothetical protein F0L68_31980 [Solihabitans fulvus]|uniref:Uncharacterized protein n=1 Tax=Solihabitans fulvus TaxID=1892852 RepID=A0A5B2WQ76_9PSEU|nr:hypothetical protein [Solihabitans fulvus]KAA2253891.1 hypothetical protein F0L68_31980 [Solihabitans fulvus]
MSKAVALAVAVLTVGAIGGSSLTQPGASAAPPARPTEAAQLADADLTAPDAAARVDEPGWHGPVTKPVTYTTQDFPAGVVCRFHTRLEFLANEVVTRTWSNDAGAPVFATATGKLVIRVTNVDSGRSVDRDISGNGTLSYPTPDSYVLSGPGIAAALTTQDTPHNKFVVVSERGYIAERVVMVGGQKRRTVLHLIGPYEDLCHTLAR